jgi:Rho GTPase-activating protein RGD1
VRSLSARYDGFSPLNNDFRSSFVKAWHTGMRIHEGVAENRLRFSQRLNEMSEELASLAKEVDKNRKQVRDQTSPRMPCSFGRPELDERAG